MLGHALAFFDAILVGVVPLEDEALGDDQFGSNLDVSAGREQPVVLVVAVNGTIEFPVRDLQILATEQAVGVGKAVVEELSKHVVVRVVGRPSLSPVIDKTMAVHAGEDSVSGVHELGPHLQVGDRGGPAVVEQDRAKGQVDNRLIKGEALDVGSTLFEVAPDGRAADRLVARHQHVDVLAQRSLGEV